MAPPIWYLSLGHLCARAWAAMLAATSSSTVGIILFTIGGTFFAWVAGRFFAWIGLRKEYPEPRWRAVKESLAGGGHDLMVTFCGIAATIVFAFVCFIPVAIYRRHTEQGNRISTLTAENHFLSAELESRKNVIPLNDPAFTNITGVLQAFQGFRGGIGKRPCVIYITAPPDSTAIATEVGTFSALSGCSTNGPSDGRDDPDVDEMTKDGMAPNVIVVHVPRDSPPGLSLQENLGSRITTKLSYTRPQITKGHQLYDARIFNGKEYFVWLQFGTGVKWNSERYK